MMEFKLQTPPKFEILNVEYRQKITLLMINEAFSYTYKPVKRPRISFIVKWIKYIPDGSTKQLKRVK